jgi:pilus assembly protein CpaB
VKSRRIPLIIGLLLALGTGALLLGYLTSLRPSTTAGTSEAVLIATHDIPARSAVSSDLFTVQQRIAAQVEPDAITDPKQLAGSYTLVAIPAGGVASRSKIGLASAATVPARLAVGMRAASIAIDDVKGVAGLITPGDRVDVIAVPGGAAGGATPRGFAILRDVLVLAMGGNVDTATAAAPGPLGAAPVVLTTVTLALTPNQVDVLDGADLNSTLRLALRNPGESAGSMPPETLRLAAAAGPADAAHDSHPVAATPNRAIAPPPAGSGVIVIDGDHVDGGSSTP